MSLFNKIKKSIEDIIIKLFKILTHKRTILLGLCGLFIYRMKNFPQEINTSDFLKLLENSSNGITSLSTLNNKVVLFSHKSQNYLCNYFIQNSDGFNDNLMYI